MSRKTREELVQEAIRLLEQRNAVEAEGLRAARRVNERLFKDEKSDDVPKIKDDAYLWRLWPFAFLLIFLGMLLLWR